MPNRPRPFPPSDLRKALSASRAFYRAHQLDEWRAALPDGRRPFPRPRGCDAAVVFPPVPVQRATMTLLLESVATRPVRGMAPEAQYAEPQVHDLHRLHTSDARNRPVGPYALAFRARPFADETRNCSARELDGWLARDGLSGLTVAEYLVLQRMAATGFGDHRFDNLLDGRWGPQWMWLLDTRMAGVCAAAGWNTATRSIELDWLDEPDADPRRGAHFTHVIPL